MSYTFPAERREVIAAEKRRRCKRPVRIAIINVEAVSRPGTVPVSSACDSFPGPFGALRIGGDLVSDPFRGLPPVIVTDKHKKHRKHHARKVECAAALPVVAEKRCKCGFAVL